MATIKIDSLIISSGAFEPGGKIPVTYTCDGKGISPEIKISNMPDDARSLALIMEDPDAPHGTFDHWLMWNIPVTNTIKENTNPGTSGINGKGATGYHPPCPPSGTHRYYFHLYA